MVIVMVVGRVLECGRAAPVLRGGVSRVRRPLDVVCRRARACRAPRCAARAPPRLHTARHSARTQGTATD